MTSAGGLVPVADAAELPAALLLSGPAGGVRAAAAVAAACGYPDAVSFDMGGTSTDVCLIRGGVPEPAPSLPRGRLPDPAARRSTCTPSAPAADRSPGSTPAARSWSAPRARAPSPGPPCYGRGGTQPTVTDADLVARAHPGRRRVPRTGHARRRRGAARRWHAPDVTADGVLAVVDAAMERSGAGGDGGAWRRPARRSRWSRSAAPDRCTRARSPTRSGCARCSCRRGPACCRRSGSSASPRRRELVRSWPTPADRAGDRGRARVGSAPRPRRSSVDGAGRVETRSTAGTPGRATSSRVPAVDAFHAEHARRNGYARPETQVEVVALRARRDEVRRRSAIADLAGAGARRGRRPRGRQPSPTAPCGCPTAGAPTPGAARRLDPAREGRRHEPRPGGAAGADRAAAPASPRRWARCCSAPRSARTSRSGPTARPRCSPPAASCSCRPSTSRCTSARCPRRCAPRSTRAATRRARRPDRRRTTRTRAARTSTTSRSSRRASSTGRLVGWVANRAHHADVGGIAPGSMPPDALEIDEEGLRIPPSCVDDGGRATCSSQAPARPTERRGDLDAQVGANRSASTRLASCGGSAERAVRRDRRLRRAPHAGRAARAPRRTWPFEDVLDSTGPRPEQQRPAPSSSVTVTVDGERDVRLHRDRRPAAGQRERGRGGDRERGRVRAAVARPIRRSRPTAARCGRCTVHRAARLDRRRRVPGRRRRRQRRGEPARRRRVPRRARAGRARAGRRGEPGHDEQRARRRRRLGVLRDDRRRAGRAARARRA